MILQTKQKPNEEKNSEAAHQDEEMELMPTANSYDKNVSCPSEEKIKYKSISFSRRESFLRFDSEVRGFQRSRPKRKTD